MNSVYEIFIITLVMCALAFMGVRSYIKDFIKNTLKKSIIKSIKTGQTFKDRMFYTKYRGHIPNSLFVWYFGTISASLVALIAIWVIHALGLSYESLLNIFRIARFGILVIPHSIAHLLIRNFKVRRRFDPNYYDYSPYKNKANKKNK